MSNADYPAVLLDFGRNKGESLAVSTLLDSEQIPHSVCFVDYAQPHLHIGSVEIVGVEEVKQNLPRIKQLFA